jgi:hypothetical protein
MQVGQRVSAKDLRAITDIIRIPPLILGRSRDSSLAPDACGLPHCGGPRCAVSEGRARRDLALILRICSEPSPY